MDIASKLWRHEIEAYAHIWIAAVVHCRLHAPWLAALRFTKLLYTQGVIISWGDCSVTGSRENRVNRDEVNTDSLPSNCTGFSTPVWLVVMCAVSVVCSSTHNDRSICVCIFSSTWLCSSVWWLTSLDYRPQVYTCMFLRKSSQMPDHQQTAPSTPLRCLHSKTRRTNNRCSLADRQHWLKQLQCMDVSFQTVNQPPVSQFVSA